MSKHTFYFLFLYCGILFAQKDSTKVAYDASPLNPIEIKAEDLAKYLDNEDFDYEVEKQGFSWWDAVLNWFGNILRSFFEWLFGADAAPKYLSVFLKYVPYLLLALLLFFVIRFFIKNNSSSVIFSKTNPNLVSLSEEERILQSENIQELIKKAFADKNYRLAIRYYYLFILKLLKERELIDWKSQKTNDDYLTELSNSELKPQFKKVTNLYDYIWYGEFVIDAQAYENAKTNFDQLKNAITTDV